MNVFDTLLQAIHGGRNPYTGFPADQWRGAWYDDPGATRGIFKECIGITKPGLIIEVGSFVGESAIHMAKIIKRQRIDAAILCVDTWYAGFDHWKGAPEKINMHFGRPDLFYRFMANVINHDCQDVIVPLAMDSIGAARVIRWLGLSPRLVYADASHEQGDVLRDFEAYWDLLPTGGGLLVDDLTNHFPGVLKDWSWFTQSHNLSAVISEGEKAMVLKP